MGTNLADSNLGNTSKFSEVDSLKGIGREVLVKDAVQYNIRQDNTIQYNIIQY